MNRKEYLLNLVAEEALEVAHAALKAARFGLQDTHPETGKTNIRCIAEERLDLSLAIDLLDDELEHCGELCAEWNALDYSEERAHLKAKRAKVMKWMAHSLAQGTITD